MMTTHDPRGGGRPRLIFARTGTILLPLRLLSQLRSRAGSCPPSGLPRDRGFWPEVTTFMADTPHPPGTQAGTVVVTFPGEIDMGNAARVGEELNAAFDAGAAIVVADMSGTRFCDTSGIHALVMAHKRAKASNIRFRVVVRPGEVRRVLEIVRLDTVLALYPRLDIALLDGDHNPPP